MSFIDARSGDLPASALTARTCVIGAGPAGMTLATELARRGDDVLLIEAGSLNLEGDTQRLYNGNNLGLDFYDLSSCSSCHRDELKIAPTLDGVFGRDIAGIPGYEYSGTLQALQGNWTRENLYLTDPFNFAPDNNMGMGPMLTDEANAIITALEHDAR